MNYHFKLKLKIKIIGLAFFCISLFCLSSCSELIQRIHRDIDQQNNNPSINDSQELNDPNVASIRPQGFKTKKFDKRPIQDPLTYTLEGDKTWDDQALMTGPIDVKRRYRSSDFEDRDASGSLWQSYDDASSFFTSTNDRKPGQIIVIDVMDGLRKTITAELKRVYPAPSLLQDQGGSGGDHQNTQLASNSATSALDQAVADLKKPKDGNKEEGRDPASSSANASNEQVEIIYDKISTRIDKTYLNDHVLLKGRKEVVFRQKKRLIEIHALVKKSTLDAKDHVKSDDIVESRVFTVGPVSKTKSWW